MQRLQDRISQPALGRLQLRVRAVLRASGAQHRARQAPGQCDAAGHCQIPRGAGTQGDSRLRAPDQDETPLSTSEILHAIQIGVITVEGVTR